MPVGPQMLEDVEEPMSARPATLRDPGTPDQIVMEQYNLTQFPSQPWCKMCVESRGHDSPHREQSKIDAVAPQPQFDYGYMEDGGPLQITCFLVGTDTSSGAINATMVPDSKKMDMPYVVATTAKWVRDHAVNYNQLISDPSTYVKKRAQRSDASILLRHVDDVVGTGPEEHLMSDFEHMKASRKGFEVMNSADLVQSLLNLYGLQNPKPTVTPGRRSTVMELASATPLDGHDYSNFRTARRKTHLHGTLETRHAIRHPTNSSTQVLNPTTDSKRAAEQLIRYLKGTQHALS